MSDARNEGTRIEWDYSISKSSIARLISELNSRTAEIDLDKDFNHTIYFNNYEHELPFGLSVRARRHSPYALPTHFRLDKREKWLLEKKQSEGDGSSSKEREKFSLRKLMSVAGSKVQDLNLTSPIVPYTADSYDRTQLELKQNNKIRITIDKDTEFFWFSSGLNGESIGKENRARVEIKMPPDNVDSREVRDLIELLSDNGARIEIGKKYAGYRKLGKRLRELAKMPVEESDTEIEAKLSLDGQEQSIFHKIKYDFYDGIFRGFHVSDRFPWTVETSAVHLYDFSDEGKISRVSSKNITTKSDEEVMKDDFGLGCILKRTEIKIKDDCMDGNINILDSLPNTIIKRRKYFLAEDAAGETYCISIDDSSNMRRHLFQIEVERTLLSPSKKEERAAVAGISRITYGISKRYPSLKPTTLTKAEWLSSLKQSNHVNR